MFATFSLAAACIVKTRERFMEIGQVLTMPRFFASNAIDPIGMMPDWLKGVAKVNPLTYRSTSCERFMVQGGASAFGYGRDLSVQLLVLFLLVIVAAKLYPSVAA